MKKYSIQKNIGIELMLPDIYIDYNKIGMISALVTLFWAFFMAPNGLSVNEITYLGLEKYFLIVLCFIVYKRVMHRMTFPYKIKIEDGGIVIKFKTGKYEKINIDEFVVDNSINADVINKLHFKSNNPVKLLAEFNGKVILLIIEEEEINKLRE